MAIMFVRAQLISRGAGRSIVAAAAYRHRTRMIDEHTGTTHRYEGSASELVHEELALPDNMPTWFTAMIDGLPVAESSEVLWNAVESFETRHDAQLARELVFALPQELSRMENIALVREFVKDELTSKGMVADWVYHDKDGNPHIHLMMTLRPMTDGGFGGKKVPVLGDDGEPLRVMTPGRPAGKIIYRTWAGDQETMKEWKIAWAETANRHLAFAGFDIRLDGRSYAEQGLDGTAQKHLGPAKAALARSGHEMYFAPADLARRQAMADRLSDEPGLLLDHLSRERSTFDERDIARTLHRYVDDPATFANIRAELMSSPELVTLKPQVIDADTGKVSGAAVFTTRAMIRTEYEMAQSAMSLADLSGFAVKTNLVNAAISAAECGNPAGPFNLDSEQIDAVRHITGDGAIAAVVGLAGAGKSILLEVARHAWESDGRRVAGAALAGRAAEGLEQSSGIASRTLAAWELAWSSERELLQRGDVFVIDEAGMVSSAQMARVLRMIADAGAKAVLVGDAMQLQPIEAGAAFRSIVERVGFAELTGVRRQREGWSRNASRLFARGEIREAIDAYAQKGHVVEVKTHEDAIERIVADWTVAREELLQRSICSKNELLGSKLLVLAQTNVDVRALNQGIRASMAAHGALSGGRPFLTARGEREFAIGDRVIFLENARLVEPGSPGRAAQHLRNGMLGTVVATGSDKGETLLKVRLDSGEEVAFGNNTYSNVDHGYAATIHKSQGTTVDRTFVLATGMMDRHLSYVAMTRHRDSADLYMAREDFSVLPGRSKPLRVNHVTGVTGELVELGHTHYRGDKDAEQTPYADVRTDDGSMHRLWGVSLPQAIERGGVCTGDTVTLRKDGVEKVQVAIAVTDPDTGCKSFENRTVNRNIWTAGRVETAVERKQRNVSESHRPDMFAQLVDRLSRSGAKTTTLDFENETSYRAQIADFGRLRAIDHAMDAVAAVHDDVKKRWSWIADQQAHVARLWERASVALGLSIEKERRLSYNDRAVGLDVMTSSSINSLVREPDAIRFIIEPQLSFACSLDEDARHRQLRSPQWLEGEEAIRAVVSRVYDRPYDVMRSIEDRIVVPGFDARAFAQQIQRVPSILGPLKGEAGIVVHASLRRERADAIAAAKYLPALIRAQAERFWANASHFLSLERTRRAHMAIGVPSLSTYVTMRLTEIEAIREKGGEGPYKAAFDVAAEDRSVVQEIKAVNEALTNRFGWNAFTSKADDYTERGIVDRMPETFSVDRKTELTRHFEAIRRFANLQHLAERRDPARIVVPAAHDPSEPGDSSACPSLPMIAAVTSFAVSIEEEARTMASIAPRFRQERTTLANAAMRVWRDPAAAVAIIDSLVRKDVSPDRIVDAIGNDPTAYGALLGSDRIVDRLRASGRQRREAIAAIDDVGQHVRTCSLSWQELCEAEAARIRIDRERMAIAVPSLSRRAEKALVELVRSVEKDPKQMGVLTRRLDTMVRAEFAAVSKALDSRFGLGVIRSGDALALARVPSSQREAFAALLPRLQVLQSAVHADRGLEVVAERQVRILRL